MEKIIRYTLPPIGEHSRRLAQKINFSSKARRSLVNLSALLSCILVLPALLAMFRTKVVLGLAQKIYYRNGKKGNSMEPLQTEKTGLTPDGRTQYADIPYGTRYPNSYLTITLPEARCDKTYPVIVYLHGGAWIFGSPEEQSPCFFSGYADLFRAFATEGFAIVRPGYVLLPEGRFPAPLLQLDEVMQFLKAHGAEYGLDTSRITIMGSSAGATTAAQYGAACADPAYARLLGFTPCLQARDIRALVINEAPMVLGRQPLDSAFACAHYLKGSLFLTKVDRERFDATRHIHGNYPPTYLVASDAILHDMRTMDKVLTREAVPHALYWPRERRGEGSIHCFLAMVGIDPAAREAFTEIVSFLNTHTA